MAQKKRDHKAEWARRPYHSKICHWNKSSDKKKGLQNDLSPSDTEVIISMPCYYCGVQPANGVDRMDCSKGHIKTNIIPACKKCNILLCDIPFEGKILLRDGLHRMREKGILDEWEIPLQRY